MSCPLCLVFWSVIFAPVLAGPAHWPRQRRVKPSQSAPGGVWCPPARPQPPFQGRAAEGVEWTSPSSSGHLSSAEGPTHVSPPKLPDFVMRKFLFEVQPCIFISDHKSVSSHGKYSTASTFQSFSYCMRNHLLTVLTTVVQTPALSPFVIPRIRSKAVLSVGVVLLSPYITVMQVNSISPETPFNWKHKRCSPLTSPHPILQSVDVVWALRAECKVVDIVYMF